MGGGPWEELGSLGSHGGEPSAGSIIWPSYGHPPHLVYCLFFFYFWGCVGVAKNLFTRSSSYAGRLALKKKSRVTNFHPMAHVYSDDKPKGPGQETFDLLDFCVFLECWTSHDSFPPLRDPLGSSSEPRQQQMATEEEKLLYYTILLLATLIISCWPI